MPVQQKKPSGKAAGSFTRGSEATANAVYRAADVVARQDRRVADGAQAMTGAIGKGLQGAGLGISGAGQQASQVLHRNANWAAAAARRAVVGTGKAGGLREAAGALTGIAVKGTAHVAGLVASGVGYAGRASAIAGLLTAKSAPAIGGAVGGVVRGAAETASNAVDATALPASRIDDMREQLKTLGLAQQAQAQKRLGAIASAKHRKRKDQLLDLLVIGGITLGQAWRDPASVPTNVEHAFELAYPVMSQTMSFSVAVGRISSDGLVGLVSGVKGKLFEVELLEHLNDGGLPDGFHAELASSATQPGWDIRVLDENGQVSELLQAKATESVGYVKEALLRYPDIDVTTTTEVHAQLLALGLAENVRNSGISEAALQAKVEGAMQGGDAFSASDLVPSTLGLAVIALSVFLNKNSTDREKGADFGARSTKAGAFGVVGKVAMVATQTWWIGLIAGVGSGWLANRGHGKREQYEALKGALGVMQGRQGAIGFRPDIAGQAKPM
jgi:predicted transcriptional regulator